MYLSHHLDESSNHAIHGAFLSNIEGGSICSPRSCSLRILEIEQSQQQLLHFLTMLCGSEPKHSQAHALQHFDPLSLGDPSLHDLHHSWLGLWSRFSLLLHFHDLSIRLLRRRFANQWIMWTRRSLLVHAFDAVCASVQTQLFLCNLFHRVAWYSHCQKIRISDSDSRTISVHLVRHSFASQAWHRYRHSIRQFDPRSNISFLQTFAWRINFSSVSFTSQVSCLPPSEDFIP